MWYTQYPSYIPTYSMGKHLALFRLQDMKRKLCRLHIIAYSHGLKDISSRNIRTLMNTQHTIRKFGVLLLQNPNKNRNFSFMPLYKAHVRTVSQLTHNWWKVSSCMLYELLWRQNCSYAVYIRGWWEYMYIICIYIPYRTSNNIIIRRHKRSCYVT